jgi:hypothetical protein
LREREREKKRKKRDETSAYNPVAATDSNTNMGDAFTMMGIEMAPIKLGMALLTVFIGYFLVRTVRAWLRLRHIPGPPAGGFSAGWMVSAALSGRFVEDLHEVSKVYGEWLR